ncbi:growth arrest and DNA damage-inducible proteins-interacting protein CRIF [Rhynchophorus ferrugineus]|uniref:growth arrest and DNA damage-inducible proteins-interacting protein CRIF n=1 Tax=Rhynchophorus ferrugineus TaxID=354439 RepID=UPI003FCC873A
MIRNDFSRKLLQIQRNILCRYTSSDLSKGNIEKLEAAQVSEVVEDELLLKEEELERKRNKSRLKDHHRNMLHDNTPIQEAQFWHQGTLKYLRRLYGRYGAASGVDPALCWPVKAELHDAIEYEQIKYPKTVSELIQEAKINRQENNQRIMERQNDIVKKMEKLEQWKKDLYAKIEKNESEAMAAKERRERLIEEVRRHFGYTVDPRDDRFKELLEKKEKEQKKAMKEARKKAREERMVKKILVTNEAISESNVHDAKMEKVE